MHRNAVIGCIIGSLCGAVNVGAAEDKTAAVPDYRPISISAEAGSTGFGGAARWRFADHFGLRGGMDYFSYTQSDDIEGISYDADLTLQSEPLTLDIFPWKDSSFYISIGVALNQNELTGTGTPTGSIDIGDGTYTPAEVGVLNLSIEQQSINPYLSLGGNLLYFGGSHRVALAGELGVMYTGSADVSLSRTSGAAVPGLDADIEAERKQIEDALNDYQFWPVAKLALTVAF